MKQSFNGIFAGLPVLVTGHTGFKGSWLSIWLRELGARVIGYSLPEPPSVPSNFEVCCLGERMVDMRGDVRHLARLRQVVVEHQPRLIFHLAAQPLVLRGYEDPVTTFQVNVEGTVNVLEVLRTVDAARAALFVTTDKVYENQEWLWGYRENDRLGGRDPYSASKAMAELAIASYRRSYFAKGSPAVATARAGNVIGGGDFADYRLVPDCMRALMTRKPIAVRHPGYVRPWQHVLESLSGYLCLAAHLLRHGPDFAEAWNFAPRETHAVTAQTLVEKAITLWEEGEWVHTPDAEPPKETALLRLNWDKAANRLGWQPVYSWSEALAATVEWFQAYRRQEQRPHMYDVCVAQIQVYTDRARALGLSWATEASED